LGAGVSLRLATKSLNPEEDNLQHLREEVSSLLARRTERLSKAGLMTESEAI
jgi:hypothetical protein